MIHYKVSMLCARVQLDRRYNREVTAIGIQSLRSCPIREVTPRDLNKFRAEEPFCVDILYIYIAVHSFERNRPICAMRA